MSGPLLDAIEAKTVRALNTSNLFLAIDEADSAKDWGGLTSCDHSRWWLLVIEKLVLIK